MKREKNYTEALDNFEMTEKEERAWKQIALGFFSAIAFAILGTLLIDMGHDGGYMVYLGSFAGLWIGGTKKDLMG